MKRILVFAVLLLLVGCTDEQNDSGLIQRAVIERVVSDNNIGTEEIMVFDQEELDDIQGYLSETKWQPNVEAEMARKEDVVLRLFIELEKNLPERINTYRIWYEQDQSMTILSNVETEGYGRLNAEFGKPFKELLQPLINEKKQVIDIHGQLENEELFEQFLKDIEANNETLLEMTRYTIEGDPIYWTIEYDGQQFAIEIDNREDAFGSKTVENYQCTKLDEVVTGSLIDYNFTGCEEGYDINLLSVEKTTEASTKLEIPNINFVIGDQTIKTYKGAYSWSSFDASTGETTTTMTDHASPNQMMEAVQEIEVNLNEPVEITFDSEPTKVEFNIWNEAGIISTYHSLEEIKETGPIILEIVGYWNESRATYVTALINE
ncbi:DUF4362 domain-containing protein [Solibacillus merdavium]|nr:DUF4362 domain-containing protein [Solibacillus merdavium]